MEMASPPHSSGTRFPIVEPTNNPIQISFFRILSERNDKTHKEHSLMRPLCLLWFLHFFLSDLFAEFCLAMILSEIFS